MSTGISGSYDGEGPNVSAASATAPGPAPTASPDVWAQTNGLHNGNNGGQGRQAMMRVDRRGRLRTAEESYRQGVALNVSVADQALPVCARGFYANTVGDLVVRLADDTVDTTFLAVGQGFVISLAIAIVRKTGTTVTGVLLF